MPDSLVFPIGFVSSQTGLSPHVIRAWERRYQAVMPKRSNSRRRLYHQADIERLLLLKRAIQLGHRISTIAGLQNRALKDLIHAISNSPEATPGSFQAAFPIESGDTVDACMDAVATLNGMELNRLLRQATVTFSRYELLEKIVRPLMDRVGRRWSRGVLRIVHAQGASAVVHAHLVRMLEDPADSGEKRSCILIATPAGQRCCLGALAVCILAQDHGWQPIFLGTDLPAEEIAAACAILGPQMIALSITCRIDDRFMAKELIRLAGFLDGQCILVVGGRASQAYRRQVEGQMDAAWVTTDAFTDMLR